MATKLLTVRQVCEAHPAFTEGGLRFLIFKSASNGLDAAGAVIRIGRKVLIDETAFLAWVHRQGAGRQVERAVGDPQR